jgi:hypothetical protein
MPPRPKDPLVLDLERRAHEIGDRIGAPQAAYPPFDQHLDAGYPNVLRRDGEWVWEVHERGKLLQRRTSRDEDDILYWIFVDVTRWMGSERARKHPTSAEDSRVGWAGPTLELLGRLDPRWEARFRLEEDSWLSTIRWPEPSRWRRLLGRG